MDRYSRQRLVKEIGAEGQERIRGGSVLIVGLGGLGSPAALYLAASGIGVLGLADGDRVERSNLQRQVIHRSEDEGLRKTDSAARAVRSLNPDVSVRKHEGFLDASTADVLVAAYDIVVSATDSLESKLMLSDACVRTATPCVHAGVSGIEGQVMTFRPGSACYRCAFDPKETPGSATSFRPEPFGTLGVAAGVAGTLQAAEALKYICGFGKLLESRMLLFDIADPGFRTMELRRRPECFCNAWKLPENADGGTSGAVFD
ncbi:adenylyltransferase [Prosthecochloris sp. GSB1]|uniref:HesA/MoeB/ThiF family protein n=1 Tax=Prosthecochloris sp. GSB1 TaxID=281093 RepID=UPI000B8C8280|nr:HesA/MoeB/ThiF family protein [Prosthecochloris sp. GSB1]ASQ91172.1 adenylyltransferase [Prosthecochloris sp. GSB1]